MLKIATYNLRNLYAAGTRTSYGVEIKIEEEFVEGVVKHISQKIQEIEPHVLVAQEVASPEVFGKIASLQKTQYTTFTAPADVRGIGNATLVNIEAKIESVPDVQDFPVMVVGDADTIGSSIVPSRHYVHIETIYRNRPLHIFGIHLKAGGGASIRASKGGALIPAQNQSEASDDIIRAGIFRLAQARRLRQLADAEFSKDINSQIIILGDFNAIERSDALEVIQGVKKYPETFLVDACDEIPKEGRFSYISRDVKILIDHVLVSPNLLPYIVKTEILNNDLVDQSGQPETNFQSSDHAPIVLTLK